MVAIFVLAVFFLILSIDLIVLKLQGRSHPAFETSFSQHDAVVFESGNIKIPSNIFLSKGHTWLRKNNDGLIYVGIDAFGLTALGPLSILKCAETGKEIKRGEVIFEGSYGNKNIKFLSPINGIVKSVNTDIINNKISNSYESWGVKLSSKDFNEDRKLFLSGNEAVNWMKNEFVRLKNFIDSHLPKVELAGVTMYDGGTLSNDFATLLDVKSTNDFEKEFLSL